MIIDGDLRTLLMRLLDKSRKGEVEWLDAAKAGVLSVTAGEDYVVVFPDSTINVYKTQGPDEGEIQLNILNSEGTVALSLSESVVDRNDRPILRELFEQAKFKVLNVQGTLESILGALEQPGKAGLVVSKKVDDDMPF